VFNAVASTILAVAVLSMSKSYVFTIFFKALCLVCLIGGAHGLWLLPLILCMVGGSKEQVSQKQQPIAAGDSEVKVASNGKNMTV